MANSKSIGAAYSDQKIDGGIIINSTISGNTITNDVTGNVTGNLTGNVVGGLYVFATAITAGVTTTTAPSGSIGVTSHATGAGSIFVSKSGKWEFPTVSAG